MNSGVQAAQTSVSKLQEPVLTPGEGAFAFCFDVLAIAGSMPLTTMSSLLSPWGWTRDALVERMTGLQDDGFVVLTDVPAPKKRRTSHVCITPAGKHASAIRVFSRPPCPAPSSATEKQQRRIQRA